MAAELFRPTEGFTFDYLGQPVFIDPTTLIEAGHPIMKGREHLFEPVFIQFANPRSVKDEHDDAPVSAVRADHVGARSRTSTK